MDPQRLREINEAIDLNADYAESNDHVKAGKYVSALRRKLSLIAEFASRGSQGEAVRHDMETLEKMLTSAEKFLLSRRGRANAGFRLRGFTRMRERAADV